jgi:hypothetical protein
MTRAGANTGHNSENLPAMNTPRSSRHANGAGRTRDGKFAAGNPGGPGRPRRAAEREYLTVLAEACSLDDWRAIVATAVASARNGDPKARAWLASYLVGTPESVAPTLHALAVDEITGADPVDEAARMRELLRLS